MFMFPLKNLARKELKCTAMTWWYYVIIISGYACLYEVNSLSIQIQNLFYATSMNNIYQK